MSPDQLARRAKEMDSFSTALINVGVTVIKRHPVPVSDSLSDSLLTRQTSTGLLLWTCGYDL